LRVGGIVAAPGGGGVGTRGTEPYLNNGIMTGFNIILCAAIGGPQGNLASSRL